MLDGVHAGGIDETLLPQPRRRAQARCKDIGADHIAGCTAKLERLKQRHHDLAGCLDSLLVAAQAGTAYLKIYRHFTMYDDPRLKPQLYQPK
jgi:hypothetical protein